MHPEIETSPELWGDWEDELRAAAGFADVQARAYDWSTAYETERYLRLLRTHSDHIMLGTERQSALLAAVGAVIDRHGGTIPVSYVTVLCLARSP